MFTYGSRPFTGGMCRGAEEALGSMRAGGWCIMQTEGFGSKSQNHSAKISNTAHLSVLCMQLLLCLPH